MKRISVLITALSALSCLPKHQGNMVQVDRAEAARALISALEANAITRELSGFGHYRGTQGLLAMEGSFSLQKDTQRIRVVMHGPFGGVLQEMELPNQGPGAVLFEPWELGSLNIEDSVLWASLSGNVLVVCLRMGYDTALVSLQKNRLTSLSIWGERFVMSDYRSMDDNLIFPFRIDYQGPEARATLAFDSLRVMKQPSSR